MDEKPLTKADLDAAVSSLPEGLTEAIHDVQAELLRGFEVYAKAVEARLRRLELGNTTQGAYETALNEGMLTLENRLVEIEKKLLDRGTQREIIAASSPLTFPPAGANFLAG